ncbi:2197_t:CDS:2, partial [Scutellospora calospora]
HEYSERLEKYLMNECGIKKYDFSKFIELRVIGEGGSAIMYSAKFQDETYALKSLRTNLHIPEKSLKKFIREYKCFNDVKQNHDNIVNFYGIARERPELIEISHELERLSTEKSVEFIRNDLKDHYEYTNNNSKKARSRLKKGDVSVEGTTTQKKYTIDETIKECQIKIYNCDEFEISDGEKAYWKSRKVMVTLNDLDVDIHESINEDTQEICETLQQEQNRLSIQPTTQETSESNSKSCLIKTEQFELICKWIEQVSRGILYRNVIDITKYRSKVGSSRVDYGPCFRDLRMVNNFKSDCECIRLIGKSKNRFSVE